MQIQQPKAGYVHANIIHNIYHEVPEDWHIRTFGSFAKEINTRHSKEKDGPVLSVTKYKGFVKSLEYFKRQIYSKDIKKYKLVEKGDFAYATIHLDEGSLGLLKEFDHGYISPMYTVFRSDSSIDRDFLYLLLKSNLYLQIYNTIGQGSINRRKSILFDSLSQLNIPMPELEVQKKISLVISNIDNLIRNTLELIEQTQRLKKGLMQKLLTKGIGHTKFKKVKSFFGKYEEIPEGWRVVKLGDLARIRYGLWQPPEQDEDGIPMIRATNIKKGKILENGIVRIKASAIPKSSDLFLRTGEIIIVRSGVYTGDIGQVTPNFEGAIAGYDLVVSLSELIKSTFLTNYLLSSKVQDYFSQLKSRVAQSHLNAQQLSDTVIFLPPLPEQNQIDSLILDLDNHTQLAMNQRSKLKSLKEGLIQQLLTGKLRIKL